MTHVRTSPYYPQSNGKLERFHRTIKHDAIRRFDPSDPGQARQVIARFVDHYDQLFPLAFGLEKKKKVAKAKVTKKKTTKRK